MQTSTLIVLACVLAVVAAAQHEVYPADALESYSAPAHDRSPRTKRGLLLLKKKLLLGAIGLKAAKVGVVGAAGVAGALALKGKGHGHGHIGHAKAVHRPAPQVISQNHHSLHQLHHFDGPAHSHVEVHDWSG